MKIPRVILFGGVVLFALIGLTALIKKSKNDKQLATQTVSEQSPIVQEIAVEEETPASIEIEKPVQVVQEETEKIDEKLPEANLIEKLFATDASKLDVVETITYTSRVPWLKGRPAWIADYASHYETTRHFIARSLNKKVDYFTQKVSPGDRINVLKKNISFYLLIDLSRSKMWFYAIDKEENKRTLIKTYDVGLGRKDETRPSGCLTPIGKYSLGNKVAIYKPGTMGYFQDRKIEMIRVFGTRWIPFDKEVEECSDASQGYGLHGTPWIPDSKTNMLVEDQERIGKYDSDGCIRLSSEDVEELFAIVISKPTIVELVKDFHEAKLPGEE